MERGEPLPPGPSREAELRKIMHTVSAEDRRRMAKNHRLRMNIVVIPSTPKEFVAKTMKFIRRDYKAIAINNDIAFWYRRGKLTHASLERAYAAAEKLQEALFGGEKKTRGRGRKRKATAAREFGRTNNPRRGQDHVVNLGIQRRYSAYNDVFKGTHSDWTAQLREGMEPMMKEIETMMRYHFPAMMARLDQIGPSNCGYSLRWAGYPCCTLVCGATLKLHQDDDDCKNTLCVMVAFGDFEGCTLEMPYLGYSIEFRPGDIIILRGHLVHHRTTELLKGKRYCAVFYCDKNLFTTAE